MALEKNEKRVLIATGLLLSLFVFSILYAKGKYKSDVPECIPYDKGYETPKVIQLDAKTFQVFAVASMWQFQPGEIEVPAGSTVDFFLVSKDVVHGFNITEKNVNMMAIYGGLNKTTVTFDKPGAYDIICHEYCGVGHQNMKARVIVTPTINK